MENDSEDEQGDTEDEHDVPSQNQQNKGDDCEQPHTVTIHINAPITIVNGNYHAAADDDHFQAPHQSPTTAGKELHTIHEFVTGDSQSMMALDRNNQLPLYQTHNTQSREPIVHPHRRSGAFDDGNIGMDADSIRDLHEYHHPEGAGYPVKPYTTDDISMLGYSGEHGYGMANQDVVTRISPAPEVATVASGVRSMQAQSKDKNNTKMNATPDEIIATLAPTRPRNGGRNGRRERGRRGRRSRPNSKQRPAGPTNGDGRVTLSRDSPIQTRSKTAHGGGKGSGNGVQGATRAPPRNANRAPPTRLASGRVEKGYNQNRSSGRPKAQAGSYGKSKEIGGKINSHYESDLEDFTTDGDSPYSDESTSSSATAPGKGKTSLEAYDDSAATNRIQFLRNVDKHLRQAAQLPTRQNRRSATAIAHVDDQRKPHRSTMTG